MNKITNKYHKIFVDIKISSLVINQTKNTHLGNIIRLIRRENLENLDCL